MALAKPLEDAFPLPPGLALAWAQDARAHWRAKQYERAFLAAQKALCAHGRFGKGEECEEVRKCREVERMVFGWLM